MKLLLTVLVTSLLAVAPVSAKAATDGTSADPTTTPKANKAKKKKAPSTASKAPAEAATNTTATGEKHREGVTAK